MAESVPLALLAAQRVSTTGFQGMLEQVIEAGGDTDTNASIAGQIAGAELGWSELPPDLRARIPQTEVVLGIAERFAASLARGG